MKLSDVNKLKSDIRDARINLACSLSEYKDWQAYMKEQEKSINMLKRSLTTLNNAVLARKAATAYQKGMVYDLSLLKVDLQASLKKLKMIESPDGYDYAVEQVRQLHNSGIDSGLIEMHAKALLSPFSQHHETMTNKARIENKIFDTSASIAAYTGHIRRALIATNDDSLNQRNIADKIARLTTIHNNDALNTKHQEAYTKQALRLTKLEKQYSILADNIVASPSIADDIVRQMENAARSRIGHIHKRQAAIKAQKEKAKRNLWDNGSSCSIAVDVFYKHTGTDYRKTLTVATSKAEKQKAPIGKALNKYR